MTTSDAPFAARLGRVTARLDDLGVDALMVSVGPDLPWLTGYEAMPLERLTMAVVTRDGRCTLVVPALEAPRVVARDHVEIVPWGESDDPIALVTERVGAATRIAFGDRTWPGSSSRSRTVSLTPRSYGPTRSPARCAR